MQNTNSKSGILQPASLEIKKTDNMSDEFHSACKILVPVSTFKVAMNAGRRLMQQTGCFRHCFLLELAAQVPVISVFRTLFVNNSC